MQDSFWKKLNQAFDRIHLQDTELRAGDSSVFINPAMKLAAGWAVFLIALLLFILIGKPFSDKEVIASGGDTEREQVTNKDYTPFERNMYPEVNSFVENYLKAYLNCDMTLLNTMVVDPAQFDEAKMKTHSQMVDGYSNFDCYTKPGLEKGSYVVYTVVNTQVPGVSVQPLSLHRFYLIPNEFGGFMLNNTTSSDPDVEAYLNQVALDPDVLELVNRVVQNNEESAQADEALGAFYEKIRNGQ